MMPPESPFAPLLPRCSWNFAALSLAFVLGVVLQYFALPEYAPVREIAWQRSKAEAFLVLDVLVLVRMAAAFMRRERSQGWIHYSVLMLLSPVWVLALFYLGARLFGPRV